MDPKLPSPQQPILFFDGVCNLCNGFIDFLVRNDSHRKLRYAPLQGKTASELLRLPVGQELSSVVLWENGKTWTESDAALRALAKLGGSWALISFFLLVPKSLRDEIYRWVARNRYRWFGKRESCRLPNAEERELFFD